MNRRVFRFAPSPNGNLHLGHAYSALLNARMADECGGRFLVRIEDVDTIRCTPRLARQALEDLAWLGLGWEQPVRYQSQHLSDYSLQQTRLAKMGLLYPCFCSRRQLAERDHLLPHDPDGQPLYDGLCRQLSLRERTLRQLRGEPHAMRIDMQAAISRTNGTETASMWGDVILVRKDIGTSYHVAVVTDDALQVVTDVVRGMDLEAATSIHVLLQKLLGLPTPSYIHHKLITDEARMKLSKRAGSTSLRMLRDLGIGPRDVRRALGFS